MRAHPSTIPARDTRQSTRRPKIANATRKRPHTPEVCGTSTSAASGSCHHTEPRRAALALTHGLPGRRRPAPTPGRRPECTSRPRGRHEPPQVPYTPGLAGHGQKLPRCRRSACIAQRVEQAPSKRLAAGSSPAGGAPNMAGQGALGPLAEKRCARYCAVRSERWIPCSREGRRGSARLSAG